LGVGRGALGVRPVNGQYGPVKMAPRRRQQITNNEENSTATINNMIDSSKECITSLLLLSKM
jgi:hypothetical protein